MVNYPASIDNSLSLPAAVDGSSTVSASIVNRLRTTIIDIQTELGVQPSGVYTNVKTRLDTIEGIVGDFQAIELAGDLGGTISTPLVTGLQGNPISPTAPTTGQALTWNGSVWAPTTPSGSGSGTFTAAGDLSGTDSSQTVIKINGATVPAAGSLTTGHVLKVSGVSANTYGYILDANIDAAAEIAVSKLEASGTNGHVLTTLLGIPTWTAATAPGGSDTQLQFNDGGAFGGDAGLAYNKTTNILSLSDALAIGTDMATTGAVRLALNGKIVSRNNLNSDDNDLIYSTGAGDELSVWGTSGTYGHSRYKIGSGATMYMSTATTDVLALNNNQITIGTTLTNETTATYGSFITELKELTTADDTISEIYTWTITDEATTVTDVCLTAITDDGATSDAWKGTIMFNRNGGTVTATTPVTTQLGASAWVFTLDNSTSTGRVRVTGAAATNIRWVATVRLQVTTTT